MSCFLVGIQFSRFVFLFQCPEAIVELYNSALEHLGAVASSRSLQNLSWPMKEFSDRENGEHGKDKLFLFNHSRNFKGLQPSMFYVCSRDRSLFIAQGGRRIIWF